MRWIPKENFHVTLLYLGEVETLTQEEIQTSLQEQIPPKLSLHHQILHPKILSPKEKEICLVLELELHPSLVALRNQLVKILPSFKHSHEFLPHITIGRGKEISKSRLETYLLEFSYPTIPSYVTKNITLFESTLSQKGSRYVEVESYGKI